MKKIFALIAVLALAASFAVAGCQKQEAQKPAEQPTAAPAAPGQGTAPAAPAPAAPEKK